MSSESLTIRRWPACPRPLPNAAWAPRIPGSSVEVVPCHDRYEDDDNDDCREQQQCAQNRDQPGMTPRGIREYPGDRPWILAPERRSVEDSKRPCHDDAKGLAKAFDSFFGPPLSWELEERSAVLIEKQVVSEGHAVFPVHDTHGGDDDLAKRLPGN